MTNTPQSPLNAACASAKGPYFTRVFNGSVEGEGPLSVLNVAVNDLFDVRGHITHTGSEVRKNTLPALKDAEAVAHLRGAGVGFFSHANMTEFAYSGLGLNPHNGTPLTPLREGCIAVDSTSAVASDVARGVASIALGRAKAPRRGFLPSFAGCSA
ncbi:amidase family protein [Sulfitobacter sp.]|uniref:amidase family protein n=1 Tax=Sulfitobacter sp. TaxID=1903071 RepID=UPI003002FD2C